MSYMDAAIEENFSKCIKNDKLAFQICLFFSDA